MKAWIPVCASLSVSVTRTTVQFSVLSVTTFVIISYSPTTALILQPTSNASIRCHSCGFFSVCCCANIFQEQHLLFWKVHRYQQAGLLSFVWCYLRYGYVWQYRIMMLFSSAGHTATTDGGGQQYIQFSQSIFSWCEQMKD